MDRQFYGDMLQEVSCRTDAGRVRVLNEDFVMFEKVPQTAHADQPPAGIYVLADGMGGHEHGEVASRLAARAVISTLLDACEKSPNDLVDRAGNRLKYAFQRAHALVKARNRGYGMNMGTTLVAAIIVGQETHIASVGDSRAYIITRTGIQQLTTDHTMTQKLLESGAITHEQTKNHPYEHMLTQAIGLESVMEVDLFQTQLMDGDTLLLCSDGLTRELDDKAIHRIVSTAMSSQSACDMLITAANQAGGRDNIAVVVVRLKDNHNR